jgi:GTP cyclohydrolase I
MNNSYNSEVINMAALAKSYEGQKEDESLKIKQIAGHFREIMRILELDLNDDSLKRTPQRVAKMMVREAFAGLNPENKPEARLFENKYRYDQMLIEKDITLFSYCEHHFVPFIGKVHIGYFSDGHIIGLSKINRLVDFYAKRPQVQERLTVQIASGLKEMLGHDNVAVVVDAVHLCVASRGVKDTNSSTLTSNYSGRFKDADTRAEFISLLYGTKNLNYGISGKNNFAVTPHS